LVVVHRIKGKFVSSIDEVEVEPLREAPLAENIAPAGEYVLFKIGQIKIGQGVQLPLLDQRFTRTWK